MQLESYSQEVDLIFETMFKEEYSGLLRYAASVLRNQSNGESVNWKAEEAVQEMFATAWEKREDVLSSEKPVGYLYKALYYKVLEVLAEERKWTRRILKAQDYYEERLSDFVDIDIGLDDVVSQADYMLLKRLYLESCSYKELCEEMGMTKSALAMKIKRIKERFIKEFNKET